MIKKLLLVLSAIFLIGILFLRFYITNNLVFKQNTINEEELKQIISNKEECKDFLQLKYNNVLIPYDEVNQYYLLSQIDNDIYNGWLSIDNYKIDILETNKTKDEIIFTNDNIVILAYNEKTYKILNLKMTYFPVMKLDQMNNKMILYDNNFERQTLNIQTYNMSFHIRGASSALSNKPSYKLNILNSKGNKKHASLLNMREDDDWILNSMYLDKSYMIEKIGYNIWSQISDHSNELKYVELFIDNLYKGIFCLQEPADFKTYNANNKSLLVSVKTWDFDVTKPKLYNENLEYNTIIDEFELDSKIDEKEQIELLRTFVSEIRKKNYSSNTSIVFDKESISNYSLFIDLISAIDNTYKNQKILFRYLDGHYQIEVYPWDLDWSQNNERLKDVYNFFGTVINENVPYKISNDTEYQQLLKKKYKVFRNSFYNEDYIYKLIDENQKELINSGAILREQNKWGQRDLDKSVENLKYFYKEKIKLLDEYYGEV